MTAKKMGGFTEQDLTWSTSASYPMCFETQTRCSPEYPSASLALLGPRVQRFAEQIQEPEDWRMGRVPRLHTGNMLRRRLHEEQRSPPQVYGLGRKRHA